MAIISHMNKVYKCAKKSARAIRSTKKVIRLEIHIAGFVLLTLHFINESWSAGQ